MSRILAIDYGKKRTGVAVTDILQIIANGLTTVPTHQLMDFIPVDLTEYATVELVVKNIVSQVGRISGVLHCAGISTTLPLKLVTPEKLAEFFQANVFSAYNLTREVCKMGNFSKEGGSITLFTSYC